MVATKHRAGGAATTARRGPLLAVVAVVVVIIIIVAAFLAVRSSKTDANAADVGAQVPADVLAAVTNVPQSALDAVGFNAHVVSSLQRLSGQPPLERDGKPEVLYVGAEYCPYCAAERWGLIVALARFGSFSHLHLMRSSATDVYPNTPTFTFYGATFSSPYVSFVPVELETRTYAPLQHPSQAQQALLSRLDAPPYVPSPQDAGSIPFIDIGGRYLDIGASYSPAILDGLSWQTIAASLRDPSTRTAQAIDSLANELTAAVCSITHGAPASVCASPTIARVEHQLS